MVTINKLTNQILLVFLLVLTFAIFAGWIIKLSMNCSDEENLIDQQQWWKITLALTSYAIIFSILVGLLTWVYNFIFEEKPIWLVIEAPGMLIFSLIFFLYFGPVMFWLLNQKAIERKKRIELNQFYHQRARDRRSKKL